MASYICQSLSKNVSKKYAFIFGILSWLGFLSDALSIQLYLEFWVGGTWFRYVLSLSKLCQLGPAFLLRNHHRSGEHLTDPVINLKDRFRYVLSLSKLCQLGPAFLLRNYHRSGEHLTDPVIKLKDRILTCAAVALVSDKNLLI
jgi:hypothetical protein